MSQASATATDKRTAIKNLLSQHGLLMIFVVFVVIMAIISPSFRTTQNLVNIVEQQSIIGIVACGMLLMIMLGGFDLSVGATGAASGVVAAWMMSNSGIVPGIAAALAVGLLIGVLNGMLVSLIGINPFVVTLGMQSLVYGVLYVLTKAQPVYGTPYSFTVVGLGRIGPIPVAAIIFLSVAALIWAALKYTTFGHRIYAVGGSPEASRLAGIRVNPVVIWVYGIGAVTAAIGGLIQLGQTSIGQPAAGQMWPLQAIAAVAIAGIPLTGGSGSVGPVIIGTLLLGTVSNALNQFGVSPYWSGVFTGLVIIVAVGLDTLQRRRRQAT